MGKINATDFKNYSKPLEEQLEEGWEAPLPEKTEAVDEEKKEA